MNERIPGFTQYLKEHKKFSERVFGPGPRTQGLIDHIRQELLEIEADPLDLKEWVDVIILAIDGAWRAGFSAEDIANGLYEKLEVNKARKWPDWREHGQGKSINHIRDEEKKK